MVLAVETFTTSKSIFFHTNQALAYDINGILGFHFQSLIQNESQALVIYHMLYVDVILLSPILIIITIFVSIMVTNWI